MTLSDLLFLKMIPAKTQYKTYNGEFLAIVELFKTWYYYLEDCTHEGLIFTNYNNLYRFIDTKNPSSKYVYKDQQLSNYYFGIDYSQSKANGATNALLQNFQWNIKRKTTF